MGAIFWIGVGYCLAVIFPVPGISRMILDSWKWGWDKFREK
jgi:hypothetical protein